MPILSPQPTKNELENLSAIFGDVAQRIDKYLNSSASDGDLNFDELTACELSLRNIEQSISVAELQLATDNGQVAVNSINGAIAELQGALATRATITHDLNIVRQIATMGGAIASGNIGAIASSAGALYQSLKGQSGT